MQAWHIVQRDFGVEANAHYEGVFATGNGYMSVRGSLEEGFRDDPQNTPYLRVPGNTTLQKLVRGKAKHGTYIAGIMGRHPILNEETVNAPWFVGIDVTVNGVSLDPESGQLSDHERHLDLRTGELVRSFTWKPDSETELRLEFRRFVSMAEQHLALSQISIAAVRGSGRIAIESGITAEVLTNGYDHYADVTPTLEPVASLTCRTDLDYEISVAMEHRASGTTTWTGERTSRRVAERTAFTLPAGTTWQMTKTVSVYTSNDPDCSEVSTRMSRVTATLAEAQQSTYEQLLADSARSWTDHWERSDVAVEGDAEVQRAMRFSVFHLLRSNARLNPHVSICAKGFAGDAYYGRYFWDTEIFMLPFFIYTDPVAARNLIMYRYHMLKGARENAAHYGYQGARFPWHSGVSGTEQCALWQFADLQIHVTADVTHGAWHYFRATNDMEFLMNAGLEMLIETSRYWVDRIDVGADGSVTLGGVIGPDEYTMMSRNNAYTNYMVRYMLRTTVQALEIARKRDSSATAALLARLGVEETEIASFTETADGLRVPFDAERNLVLQSDEFESLADLDLRDLLGESSHLVGRHISEEKRYRSKCLKQADVVLLMALFPHEFDAEAMRTAYEYYEPLTTHDSSLSPTTHAIVATWLGKQDDADRYFRQSMGIDLDLETRGAAEGIHVAAAAGNWQFIAFGLVGIRTALQSDTLTLEPRVPEGLGTISFAFVWKGQPLTIEANESSVAITNRSDRGVDAEIWGTSVQIPAGERIEITAP